MYTIETTNKYNHFATVSLPIGMFRNPLKRYGVEHMLKDQVFAQLKVAMKEKDILSKGVLQLVKAALDAAEKEKGANLTEAEEIAVINREVKQTNQALEGAESAGRQDLIEKEQAKLTQETEQLKAQLAELQNS